MGVNQVRTVGGGWRHGVRVVDAPDEGPVKKPRKRASKPAAAAVEVVPADPFFDADPPEAA